MSSLRPAPRRSISCSLFAMTMTAHWGQPDPAAAEGTEVEKHLAFADAFRMLYNRISIFTSLPMKSLDKLSLQRQLDEIGKTNPVEEKA